MGGQSLSEVLRQVKSEGVVVHAANLERLGLSLVFREIDQDDVRVITQSVEHDPRSVGGDVKCADGAGVVEPSQLAVLHRRQVEEPEVLVKVSRGLHVDQTPSVREKSRFLAQHMDLEGRQLDRGPVGADTQHWGERI